MYNADLSVMKCNYVLPNWLNWTQIIIIYM